MKIFYLVVVLGLVSCAYPPQGRDYFEVSISSVNPVSGVPIEAKAIVDRTGLLTAYGERETSASLSMSADGVVTAKGGHRLEKKTVNNIVVSAISTFGGYLIGAW